MLVETAASIFDSPAKFICNPVNCSGVMGAGLARQFKIRFPSMHTQYKTDCDNGLYRLGIPRLWVNPDKRGRHVINFPTKNHWREYSDMWYIRKGFDYILLHEFQWGIPDAGGTIGVPALGCGLGGLDVREFENLLKEMFDGPPDSGWTVYYHIR